MGIYRSTGDMMIVVGIFGIANSIFSIISNPTFMGYSFTSIEAFMERLRLLFMVGFLMGIISLVLISYLGILSFKLGEESDEGTLKAGAILLIITYIVSFIFGIYLFLTLEQFLIKAQQGLLTLEELQLFLMRVLGLGILNLALSIISYIVYGLGLRHLADILGLNDLKTAGLLVILGFIPFLFQIGLILGGLDLRKIE